MGDQSQEELQGEYGGVGEFSCMCAYCKIPVRRRIFSWSNFLLGKKEVGLSLFFSGHLFKVRVLVCFGFCLVLFVVVFCLFFKV